MKKSILLLISAAALCLTSCTSHLVPLVSFAHFSRPLNTASGFTNSAAIYGRFMTEPDFAFGNELAVRLQGVDSKRVYLIRCRDKNPVYAIAVEPGRYMVAGFIGTFMDHRPVGGGGFPEAGSFDVRSNALTYIGDFTGYAKVGMTVQTWGISSFTTNFSITTDDFRRQYSNMVSAPVFSAFDQSH